MSGQVFVRKSSGLVRRASLLDAFLFNSAASGVAYIIVFYAYNITWLPGGDILTAMLFLVPAFSIAIVYAFLTSTMPRSGGDYVFNSRILHPSLGFAFNFAMVSFQSIFMAFTYWWIWETGFGPGFGLLGYVTNNPGLVELGTWVMQPINSLILGTILNVIFMVIAIAGTKYMLRILNVLYVIALIGIFGAIITLASTSNSQFVTLFNNFIATTNSQLRSAPNPYQAAISMAATNQFTPPPFVFSLPLVAMLSGTVIWTFYSAYFAGEIKGADSVKTNIIGMLGSGLFNLVTVFLLCYTYLKTIGYQFFASITYLSYTPGILPAGWGPWSILTFFFGLVAGNPILAAIIILGLTLAQTLIYPPVLLIQIQRNLFGWSVDRLVPDKLCEVSPKYHSPTYAVIACAIIVEVILVALIGAFGLNPSLINPILALTIIGPALASMLLPGFAAILLPRRKREIYEASPAKIEVAGVPVMSIFAVIEIGFILFILYEYLAWPQFGLTDPSFIALTFGFFVVGFVLFWIIRALRQRQGIDIDLAFREIPPL